MMASGSPWFILSPALPSQSWRPTTTWLSPCERLMRASTSGQRSGSVTVA